MAKGKFEKKPEPKHNLLRKHSSENVQQARSATTRYSDPRASELPKGTKASMTAGPGKASKLDLSFGTERKAQAVRSDDLDLCFGERSKPSVTEQTTKPDVSAVPQPVEPGPIPDEVLVHPVQSTPRKKPAAKPAKDPATEPETPKKRNPFLMVLNVIKNLLVWAITLLAVGMMIFTVVSVTTLDRNDRTLLGYRAFIVLSDSMKATDFDAGDVVLVKNVEPDTLQPGDIIAFTSQNSSNYGETVTHKIRSRTTDSDGNPAFITYGTTTDIDDETPVPYSNILGKYQLSLPKVGFFFQFLRTGPGYILFILLPFGLLIAYQGLQSVHLFRQNKKEEMKKLQEERAQVAAEREETRRMLEELKTMQMQMQNNREK